MIHSRRQFTPFQFGPAGNQLFGCHHPPQSGPGRECAVVLCAPMGHEYIRSHRALRQLAALLASAGFHVLRFDFFGCGDSAGNEEEAGIGQWLSDITMAVETLRERSAGRNICLAGLRLGGTLAAMAAADRGHVQRLILWDPVVQGSDYLDRLAKKHRQKFLLRPENRRQEKKPATPTEVFGFRCGERLQAGLSNIDLLRIRNRPAQKVLLIESQWRSCLRKLKRHLTDMDTALDHQLLRDHNVWAESHRVLVPRRTLEHIVGWLAGGDP